MLWQIIEISVMERTTPVTIIRPLTSVQRTEVSGCISVTMVVI